MFLLVYRGLLVSGRAMTGFKRCKGCFFCCCLTADFMEAGLLTDEEDAALAVLAPFLFSMKDESIEPGDSPRAEGASMLISTSSRSSVVTTI